MGDDEEAGEEYGDEAGDNGGGERKVLENGSHGFLAIDSLHWSDSELCMEMAVAVFLPI